MIAKQAWLATLTVLVGACAAGDPEGSRVDMARAPGDATAGLSPGAARWRALSAVGAPTARAGHSAVWTGSELLVFGGWDNYASVTGDGARYQVATDRWAPMSTEGAPEPRGGHVAVWTGSRMLVWGGVQPGGQFLGSGASYDPATDSWSPLPTDGAPSARADALAIWTGAELIVWGGRGGGVASEALGDGARYSPATNSWAPISRIGAPRPRVFATGVWTGQEFVVSGGVEGIVIDAALAPLTPLADGALLTLSDSYDPAADAWTPGSPVREAGGRFVQLEDVRQRPRICVSSSAVSERSDHTSTWTGAELIVWGGRSRNGTMLGDGGRYRPASSAAGVGAADDCAGSL